MIVFLADRSIISNTTFQILKKETISLDCLPWHFMSLKWNFSLRNHFSNENRHSEICVLYSHVLVLALLALLGLPWDSDSDICPKSTFPKIFSPKLFSTRGWSTSPINSLAPRMFIFFF